MTAPAPVLGVGRRLVYTRAMRRPGPLTARHVVVTALVVLLVSAQLVWWIVFTVHESENRLLLEQRLLLIECRHQADQVQQELQQLEARLTASSLPPDAAPGTALWPRSVETIRRAAGEVGAEADQACTPSWRREGDRAVLRFHRDGGCLEATLWPWPEWLETGSSVEVIEVVEGPPDRPGVQLPHPFEDLWARPGFELWRRPLRAHRSRIRMFISEGVFFILLVASLVVLLGRTVRRELDLQRQHRNFLSAITHELKSPLAAMRLSLETVLGGRADPTASLRFLENALQDTERLQSLVQKVLEVTRFGRADAALRLRRTELSEVVRDTIRTFGRLATAAGARLETSTEPEIWVRGDEESLAIVVSNLLENAIKYGGPVPWIGVDLRISRSDAVLEVRDNGGGISEEDQPFIFDRFYRGGNEMTRTTQGTGLGLFLVRQIVHAHGGTVEVAASGADGTTFRVVLPGAEVVEEEP